MSTHAERLRSENLPCFSWESVKDDCIDPRWVEPNDREAISALFLSHDWEIISSQHRPTGILVRYTCKRCDATGLAVFRIGEKAGTE